jgi:redox-sensitive bicupin YhaK (pirin superfamily)
MPAARRIRALSQSKPVTEGAGVYLRRAFGFAEVNRFDPFLLLDDFRSNQPEHYRRGFPWHPHRGIETITYMLAGEVDHGDSMGNQGTIGPGDVQWMTAGSGIIHQEMPRGDKRGRMEGFQLWANLPASQKLMTPRYRDVTSDQIPLVALDNGTQIRIISGAVGTAQGPVRDIVIEPQYLDVQVPARTRFDHPTPPAHNVFAYVIEGKGWFGPPADRPGQAEPSVGNGTLVHFDIGDQISVHTQEGGVRFLLISGRPLNQPVAWHGPIVMNTQEELQLAFEEYARGTFIKHSTPEH